MKVARGLYSDHNQNLNTAANQPRIESILTLTVFTALNKKVTADSHWTPNRHHELKKERVNKAWVSALLITKCITNL